MPDAIITEKPLVPVLSHKDTVEFLAPSPNNLHEIVVMKNIETDEFFYYPLEKYRPKDIFTAGVNVIALDAVKPGQYLAYTSTLDGLEISEPLEVTVLGENKRDLIEKALTFAGEDLNAKENHRATVSVTEKTLFPYILFEKYVQEENAVQRFAYAKALRNSIALLNGINIKTTGIHSEIDAMGRYLITDIMMQKVIDVNLSFLRPHHSVIRPNSNGEFRLLLNFSSLHAFLLIDKDDDVRQMLFFFMANEEDTAKFWEQEMARINSYQEIMDRPSDYPNSSMDFTENELPSMRIIHELWPVQPILHVPICSFVHGKIQATFDDASFAFINALAKPLYISFREPGLALDKKDCRRIEIKTNPLSFYAQTLDINKENCLVWIEDKVGNILSDIQMANFDDSFSEDLNERIRQARLHKYLRHLSPYLESKFPELRQTILEAFDSLEGDTEADETSIPIRILQKLCVRQNLLTYPRLMRAVMEDYTLYGNYLIDFLEAPMRFQFKKNTIEFPPKSACLYVIDKYHMEKLHTRDYVQAQLNVATPYRFLDCEYAVVRCLDMETYKWSGFMTIDFTMDKFKPHIQRFLLDALEVII